MMGSGRKDRCMVEAEWFMLMEKSTLENGKLERLVVTVLENVKMEAFTKGTGFKTDITD